MTENHPHFGQIIKTLRTKSAANPALIFAALCFAAGVPGVIFAQAPKAYLFIGLVLLGAFIAAFQILYFTFKDPDRLQDEQHIENKMLINSMSPMLGDAGTVIEIDAEPILVGNPRIEDRLDV